MDGPGGAWRVGTLTGDGGCGRLTYQRSGANPLLAIATISTSVQRSYRAAMITEVALEQR